MVPDEVVVDLELIAAVVHDPDQDLEPDQGQDLDLDLEVDPNRQPHQRKNVLYSVIPRMKKVQLRASRNVQKLRTQTMKMRRLPINQRVKHKKATSLKKMLVKAQTMKCPSIVNRTTISYRTLMPCCSAKRKKRNHVVAAVILN